MLIYLSIPSRVGVNKKIIRKVINDLKSIGHVIVYAPISDEITTHKLYNFDLIIRCDALVHMNGWNLDPVCLNEISYAKQQGISIYPDYKLPDLHPTEVSCPEQSAEFLSIVMRMYRTHLDKNADYSPANILGPGMIGIATRLWDKLTRFINLSGFPLKVEQFKNSTQITFYHEQVELKTPKAESIEDTLLDTAVYSIIALLLGKGKWGK
ncbi:hypothetical protein LCGC14_1593500 [marine sediment metagenome]|uniref:Uncharacterized protein n=1 Tax=marine sediment metagenome TaxID=412755 RepID=A0A0F9IZN7_9ZZZZ